MKILVTGRGTSGSWRIRGEQLGAAMGAVVKQNPTLADCKAADVIVVVKRVGEDTLDTIRKSGTPWAFDALDFYPQPGCSSWSAGESIGWVRGKLKRLAPNAVIWPTHRMRQDCGAGWKGIALAHHHRPGIERNPIRPTIQTVGYEGALSYLDGWRPVLQKECARRGWRFVENPARIADLDIVVALRGGPWDSYPAKHWKSNVKLANAHGSGTPFVGQRECGYLETSTGAEYWADDGLSICFDWLQSQSTREQVSERFLLKSYTVNHAANDLIEFLSGL